jgi:hypothetical protein
MVFPLDKILTKEVLPFMMKRTFEMIFCLM